MPRPWDTTGVASRRRPRRTLHSDVDVSGDFPPGVTLQDIDGGPTYFDDNGFDNAVVAGFDGTVFPICGFLRPMSSQGSADNLIARGINGCIEVEAGDASLSVMRTNDLWLVVQQGELSTILANNGGSLGTESVGISAGDEPSTYAQAIGALSSVSNTHQDNRFWYNNFTWNQHAFGDVEGHTMPDLLNDLISTPNATTRHLDIVGTDIYWVSGYNGADGGAFNSQTLYNLGGLAYRGPTQTRRALRRPSRLAPDRQPDQRPVRMANDLSGSDRRVDRTGSPYTENNDTAQRIQPAELNACAWSTIIHGARVLKYFMHSFGSAGEHPDIDTQQASTNGLVQTLAPVLLSPFALDYASVSPAGWAFGDAAFSAFNGTGFDSMVKYYELEGSFYVFVMPRYSPASTNQVATVTIANTGAATAEVVNEARTVNISGGTTFTDTFADGHTVHIYKVVI